ncbi:hypothetical protein AMJ39_09260 [candidate division TA06 bacterium DG_24]|uniref:histidine kinase n=1 Tax=candidate division TA06 bacterium DG_24 TaxID=1703770 RepID=A0A0S7WQB7_UNCT6|nr:MAG: hypothetical protein AMJ39_09260 [candidate division TA06 bacterium DG_24]
MQMVRENELLSIEIFDGSGRPILSTIPARPAEPDSAVRERLSPILDGGYAVHVLGYEEAADGGVERYAVAVARAESPGAIVVAVDGSYVREMDEEIGIGYLIQRISREPGIEYVLLQDEEGIVLASRNIERMPRIAGDPFLRHALAHEEAQHRITEFEGRDVLEIVKPFPVEEAASGLFRLGLSLEGYREMVTGTRRQVAVLAVLFFLLGAIAVTLIIINQNYALLNRSYREIRTLTGSVLENMRSAVVAVDASGRITVLNRAAEEMFAVSRSQALGRRYGEVFKEDECLLAETLEKGRTITGVERPYRTFSGDRLVLAVSTSDLGGSEGEASGAVAVVRDVTKVREMEESIQRSDRLSAMGNLAAGVAHEVRNPLNAIAIAAQRLEEEFLPDASREEFLTLTSALRSEVGRLNEIVQQFLSLASPPKLRREAADLNGLIGEVLELIEPEAESRDVRVDRRFGKLADVEIDREEMKKVVLNLMRNALEAMKGGGELRIRTAEGDGYHSLRIEDTGPGISRENLRKVFHPYFTTKDGGTGLGLSIAHRIVVEHGGRIEVDSVEGKGTVFTVLIPSKGSP